MASDKSNGENNNDREDAEGGLGNLPPLSDFDSSGGFASDSGLPPLSSFDSGKDKESVGGLPPLSDITIETPIPSGGNIKSPPPGFEVGDFGTPNFDTPAKKKGRTGFQDLAADSDFSPETPEIGPGPDGDIDTPLFDSAFGGAGARGFTPSFETPAPTQAMETPLFGNAKENPFDDGAFQPGAAFDAGTPMPDFSPDSTMATRKQAAPPAPPVAGKPAKAGKSSGGGNSLLKTVAIALVCLAVGIFAGPFASTKTTVIPNPLTKVIADKDSEIAKLNDNLKRIKESQGGKPGEKLPTPEEIKKMLDERDQVAAAIKDLEAQKAKRDEELATVAGQLDQVRADLENKNEEFVKAQEAFEDLQNQTAIVQARQMGLVAEVERLTGMVDTLERANARSLEIKAALEHSVERLATQVKEGIPLTPSRFARDARIAAVDDLKSKVAEAKWVTPELLNAYTDIYQKELEIGSSTSYFFAKLPLVDQLNNPVTKWAECLMKGNWAVYFRSLDGKSIGSYENIAEEGMPAEYAFRDTMPEKVKGEIEAEIISSRGPDYEKKLQIISEKQQIADGNATPMQRVFDSL